MYDDMTAARRPGSPPWGLSEYRNNVGEKMHCILRPKTRSEMLRSRRENAVSFARGQLDKRGACSMPVPVTDGWWKLAEGYRENPLEDLASSPRFQRYIRRRARARAAEGPDPFGTHQVRLRGPSKAWAEKISLADPPPPDAEAYFAPKRTVKHFTDEFFEWKARLISHGDLDKRGKSKRVTLDECAPPYSSLCSSFTGCSIDPGKNIRSASQAKAVFKASAPHLLERPSAAEVARRAHNKRRTMWKEILAATAKKPHLTCDGYDGSAGFDGCGDGMEGNGSSGNRSRSSGDSRPCPSLASSACSTDPVETRTWGKVEMRPPSAPPESNRRRYSRLCGQG